jgi:acyl carrier protein
MPAEEEVKKVVSSVLGIEASNNTAREIEPKWDSLKHVEIMFGVEDACGVRFSQQQLAELKRVDEISNAVEKLRGS